MRRLLSEFLYYGYLPSHPVQFSHLPWATIPPTGTSALHGQADFVAAGAECLLSAFRLLRDAESSKCIVPLSGGLDSRTVLAGLMQRIPKDRITAVTFGFPGSIDYEIASRVAEFLGIEHVSIDLTEVEITRGKILDAQRGLPPAWAFDRFFNQLISLRFGANVTYWSGYMGDALAGAHLPIVESRSWRDAVSAFASRRRFIRSLALFPADYDPQDAFPDHPVLELEALSCDDQLDFVFRQESTIRHAVTAAEYDYRTPFLHPGWVNFVRSVPRAQRLHSQLYREVLGRAFPEAFDVKAMNTHGLPIAAPFWLILLKSRADKLLSAIWSRIVNAPRQNRHVNYIDFDEGFRLREDLRHLATEAMASLKERGLLHWLDPMEVLEKHLLRKGNHGLAISLLISLELTLVAQDNRSKPRTRARDGFSGLEAVSRRRRQRFRRM